VLIKASERIRNIASGTGPAYRIGGDEFLVVLADNAEIERARWMADALVEAMEAPIRIGQQKVTIGASIGMALGTGRAMTPQQLIANADIALYEAKRQGRGCVRELTPRMLTQLAARRQLASELPRAIEAGEFIPFYQPQVDAGVGKVIGAEALARWQHPTHGVLAPVAFLDIAAEMGLVAAIDRSMMQQALDFAARATRQGLPLSSISVNLSAGRLADPQLVDDIDTCWQDRRCKLVIELLETIGFDDLQQEALINQNLKRLREMGVGIDTDDFGSGRASITGLLQINPDRLKIDRKLIQAAVRDPVKRNVVSAILDMSRALEIDVLAEGVETFDDVAVIRNLGCDKFQGYAYARPLPETEFCAYLHSMAPLHKTQTAGPKDLPKFV
jgi:predicted signal transduction protein with EAL and GGDEF domain